MSIPRIIWQTCRDREPPSPARPLIESWRRMNPRWRHALCDDEQIDAFIEAHFDRSLLEAFRGMPLAVMRADIWRYAVLYVHGGIYADIDTECMAPVEQWLRNDVTLLIGLENDTHFCQWILAAAPGITVLAEVLDLVCERWARGVDTSREDFVHYHTGPGLWTDALRRHLGAQGDARTIRQTHAPLNRDIAFLDATAFVDGYVRHHYASRNWANAAGYESWLDDRDQVVLRDHARPLTDQAWELAIVDDRYRIVNRHDGREVPCNDSLAWIFSRCDGARTVPDITGELRALLTDAPDSLENDIYESIRLLYRRGLISI